MQSRNFDVLAAAADLAPLSVRRKPKRIERTPGPSQIAEAVVKACADVAECFAMDVERVLYCAALALFHRCEVPGQTRGEMALRLRMYPSMAFYVLDTMIDQGASVTDVVAQLDDNLAPSPHWPTCDLGNGRQVSRLAARCGVPFFLGAGHMIADRDLDFLVKAVASENEKAARYALNYMLREDLSSEEEYGEAAAGAADGAAAADVFMLQQSLRLSAELSEAAALDIIGLIATVPGMAAWMHSWSSVEAVEVRRSLARPREDYLSAVYSGLPALPIIEPEPTTPDAPQPHA